MTHDATEPAVTPPRPRLVDALECVLGMDTATARRVADEGALWNEPQGWLEYPMVGPDDRARGVQPAGRWRLDAGTGTPRAAWESLATRGVIPLAWGGDEARVFYTRDWTRAPLGPDLSPRKTLHPPTIRSCITLGASADAMVTAEALAREAAGRLRPWLGPLPDRVSWRTSNAPLRAFDPIGALGAVVASLGLDPDPDPDPEAASDDPRERRHRVGPARWTQLGPRAAACAARWDAAAAAGALVPDTVAMPTALRGQRFASLHNPFAPLADLALTGFGLDGFDADRIALAAREV